MDHLFSKYDLSAAIRAQKDKAQEKVDAISQDQFLSSDDAVLIDVRTENEFNAGRIGQAKSIPLHRLVKESNSLKKMAENKKVYVICQTGSRSISGAVMLRKMGVPKVYNVRGGMVSWYRQGP